MLMASNMPVPVSPSVAPGFSGGPSGSPVMLMTPPVACAIMSKGVDDIGERGDGADQLGIALHVEDGAPELGADGVHRFERIVFEDFFTDFIPQVFLRIELRRIRREIQEHDVVGNDKVAAAVVGGTVENQQNVVASKLARKHVEEDLEACCIRSRHDQINASAVLGGDRAVEIDIFADELRGDRGPRADWCPARADAVHAAEARLISEHDAQAWTAPGSGPPGFSHSIRKAVFLKAFCAAKSRLG